MAAAFDLGQIGRSAARFDFAKLENLNGHYLREADDQDLVAAIAGLMPVLGPPRGLGPTLGPDLKAKLTAAMPGLKERAKTLVELFDAAYFLYAPSPLALDAKAAALLDEPARLRLAAMGPRLAAATSWTPADLETTIRAYAEETGAKLGQVAQPLRAALTGRATSPGLFDVMAVLGRSACLARLEEQTARGGVAPPSSSAA